METVFGAALEVEPELIELAARRRVILATPTTLIALLRAVHYGWRQEAAAENARVIADLGKELYSRLSTFSDHLSRVGSTLGSAVKQYNSAVGSLEASVMPSARRFPELGVPTSGKELAELEAVDGNVREVRSPRAEHDSSSVPTAPEGS